MLQAPSRHSKQLTFYLEKFIKVYIVHPLYINSSSFSSEYQIKQFDDFLISYVAPLFCFCSKVPGRKPSILTATAQESRALESTACLNVRHGEDTSENDTSIVMYNHIIKVDVDVAQKYGMPQELKW